jgi:hypothetical protein
MFSELITLTPGRRNTFIDCHTAKVWIAVLHHMDVKTRWNWGPELQERTHQLREFTRKWLKNPKYND